MTASVLLLCPDGHFAYSREPSGDLDLRGPRPGRAAIVSGGAYPGRTAIVSGGASHDNQLTPVHTCGTLFRVTVALSYARSTPRLFKPKRRVCLHTVFIAALLLLGGVELNPGPVTFGVINCCSAVRKGPLLQDLITSNDIDLLAVNETWMQPTDSNATLFDMAPSGYVTRHKHRQHENGQKATRGGGLAYVYRDSLRCKAHRLQSAFKPTSFELQTETVTVGNTLFVVANIYRPPVPNRQPFYNELSDFIGMALLSVASERFIVCGDFNCPGTDSTSVDVGLTTLLQAHGLKLHVNTATRSTTTASSLLDVVITTSDATCVSDVQVRPSHGVSDHSLITFKVSVTRPKKHPVTYCYRNIKRIDLQRFREDLQSSELVTNPANSADGFAKQLESVVTRVLDAHAPLRSKTKIAGTRDSRWLSDEAVLLKRQRRKLERRWKSTSLESDRVAYRAACRTANEKILQSRRQHYSNRISDTERNSRQRWSVVKDMLHSSPPSECKSPDQNKQLCDSFMEFFARKVRTIKTAIATKLAGVLSNPLKSDVRHTGPVLDNLAPVTTDEVRIALSALPNKSSPMDYLPTSLLKSCADVFAPLITRLANLSFADGVFPSSFKHASITPLLKHAGMDTDDPASYRPISNLNTISKLLERLFLARILPHVKDAPGFNRLQSAYQRHHSTETALLKIFNDIFESAGSKKATLLASLDISAAFDTIDTSTLISRLEHTFGITGPVLKWVQSYLTDRHQLVKINSMQSESSKCSHGVPQGSVLGPILFVLYVSPISNVTSAFGVQHHQYADDTQIYISLDRSKRDASVETLRSCTKAIHQWFLDNGMALNPDKSVAILLGTAQRVKSIGAIDSVNIAGSNITPSGSIKNLGVTFDSQLTLNEHVNNTCKAAYFHIKGLRHVRSSMTTELANTVACAIVGARIDYCNALLHGTSTSNIKKLQHVQNMLARVVTGTRKYDRITPALSKLHWLPVTHRIKYKLVMLTFKTLQTGAPSYLASLIHPQRPTRRLRSSTANLLSVPSGVGAQTDIARRAFSFAAPSTWNSLPENVRNFAQTATVSTFGNLLKTYLFKDAYGD